MVAEPPDFPSEPMTLVPRTLKGDIFSPVHAHLTLENKIELAAEASLRHSRTIGLVVLQIPAFAEIAARHGRHVADKLIGTVAMELCSSVRRGDHVAVRDNGEIIVCVTLVAVRDELSRIAARLLTVIHGLGSASEPSFTAEAGLSIYPLDGYSGEELIESARTNCLRALTRRAPEFFEIQPPEMQPPVRKRSASVPAGARKPRKKQAAPPTASIN
jgi:diguanylate cyclase (GGDEF)-like protein